MLSKSLRVGDVFAGLFLLALIPSWLGLLGQWHWGLDLLSHFRWQYLVVGWCGGSGDAALERLVDGVVGDGR